MSKSRSSKEILNNTFIKAHRAIPSQTFRKPLRVSLPLQPLVLIPLRYLRRERVRPQQVIAQRVPGASKDVHPRLVVPGDGQLVNLRPEVEVGVLPEGAGEPPVCAEDLVVDGGAER